MKIQIILFALFTIYMFSTEPVLAQTCMKPEDLTAVVAVKECTLRNASACGYPVYSLAGGTVAAGIFGGKLVQEARTRGENRRAQERHLADTREAKDQARESAKRQWRTYYTELNARAMSWYNRNRESLEWLRNAREERIRAARESVDREDALRKSAKDPGFTESVKQDLIRRADAEANARKISLDPQVEDANATMRRMAKEGVSQVINETSRAVKTTTGQSIETPYAVQKAIQELVLAGPPAPAATGTAPAGANGGTAGAATSGAATAGTAPPTGANAPTAVQAATAAKPVSDVAKAAYPMTLSDAKLEKVGQIAANETSLPAPKPKTVSTVVGRTAAVGGAVVFAGGGMYLDYINRPSKRQESAYKSCTENGKLNPIESEYTRASYLALTSINPETCEVEMTLDGIKQVAAMNPVAQDQYFSNCRECCDLITKKTEQGLDSIWNNMDKVADIKVEDCSDKVKKFVLTDADGNRIKYESSRTPDGGMKLKSDSRGTKAPYAQEMTLFYVPNRDPIDKQRVVDGLHLSGVQSSNTATQLAIQAQNTAQNYTKHNDPRTLEEKLNDMCTIQKPGQASALSAFCSDQGSIVANYVELECAKQNGTLPKGNESADSAKQ